MKDKQNLNPIQVPHGNVSRIAKVFGVTNGYVSKALRGHLRESDKVKKVRFVARTQFDGKEMAEVVSIKTNAQ